MKLGTYNHGAQRMNPSEVGDLLASPTWGWHLWFWGKCLDSYPSGWIVVTSDIYFSFCRHNEVRINVVPAKLIAFLSENVPSRNLHSSTGGCLSRRRASTSRAENIFSRHRALPHWLCNIMLSPSGCHEASGAQRIYSVQQIHLLTDTWTLHTQAQGHATPSLLDRPASSLILACRRARAAQLDVAEYIH